MEKVCIIVNYLWVFYDFEPRLRFLKSLSRKRTLFPTIYLFNISSNFFTTSIKVLGNQSTDNGRWYFIIWYFQVNSKPVSDNFEHMNNSFQKSDLYDMQHMPHTWFLHFFSFLKMPLFLCVKRKYVFFLYVMAFMLKVYQLPSFQYNDIRYPITIYIYLTHITIFYKYLHGCLVKVTFSWNFYIE